MTDNHVTPTEVLDCLRFVRTHLYAAQAQAVPGDDTIITRHVYDAYKRVSDVCREIEINGIGMEAAGIALALEINAKDAVHTERDIDQLLEERRARRWAAKFRVAR